MTRTTSIDLASGKGHKDENFPVASHLVARRYRAPIMAFYRFARAADDVADHPTAGQTEKLARLRTMGDTLAGKSDADQPSHALRLVLAERGLDPVHGHDLLRAFTQDVTKRRYADWNDLIDYCRWSAMPVGRFVLDVHGEDRATWRANDALCAALQVINHLQDIAKDYRALDRIYLPESMRAATGARFEDLAGERATPELRAAIDMAAARTQTLLHHAAGFAAQIRDRRLALEVAVIHKLAVDLAARLRARDPLSERVHHSKAEALLIAGLAVAGRIARR